MPESVMTRVVHEPPSPVYVAYGSDDGISSSQQSSTFCRFIPSFEMEGDDRAKLLDRIKAQGDVVRKLKEQKAEKSQVTRWIRIRELAHV